MTPEEQHLAYINHKHDIEKYGKYAGLCCMEALEEIERLCSVKKEPAQLTLFDFESLLPL